MRCDANLSLTCHAEIARVAGLGCSGEDLRQGVMRSMYISVGYLKLYGLNEVEHGLFAMTQGDIPSNVRLLAEQHERPSECYLKAQLWDC